MPREITKEDVFLTCVSVSECTRQVIPLQSFQRTRGNVFYWMSRWYREKFNRLKIRAKRENAEKPMKNYFTDLAITRVFEREHIFNFSWEIVPTFDNNLFHTDCRTSERAREHPQLNRIVKRNSMLPLICSWFCGVYDRVLCRWISNMLMFPWNSNFHHFSKVKPNANFVRNDAQKCWGCLAKW